MNSVTVNKIVLKRRGARREKVQVGLWLLLAPIAIYAPKATVIWLFLFVASAPDLRAAILALPSYSKSWVVRAMALFLIWAAISLVWSPEPARGALALAKLTGLSLLGIIAVAAAGASVVQNRNIVAVGVMGFAGLTICLLGIEILAGGKLGSMIKGQIRDPGALLITTSGSAILSLFVFPALGLFGRRTGRFWLVLAAFGISVLVIAPLPMFAALVGLLLGAPVFGFIWIGGKRALYCAMFLAVGIMFVQPAIWSDGLGLGKKASHLADVPTSWQHRILIWRFVSQKSMQRPILGHGFDTSRVIGRNPGKAIVATKNSSWAESVLPLHPHNVGLQVWLELGAIGVILGMGVLVAVGRAIAASAVDTLSSATVAGTLAVAWFIGCVSFGAWQSWWVAALWLSATASMILLKERERAWSV